MRAFAKRLLVISVAIGLASCGQSPLIGKWQGGPYGFIYEFLSSGDYVLTNPRPNGGGRTNKYQLIDGGRIKFEEAFGFSVICNYAVEDNVLKVSGCDGYAGTYRKV